ncbi:MAG: sel1 repeat family protein [Holosporales bacterium]|jgi:hypothetical protein|nr:sel1 repeat family protein [Holosporales bacterium]
MSKNKVLLGISVSTVALWLSGCTHICDTTDSEGSASREKVVAAANGPNLAAGETVKKRPVDVIKAASIKGESAESLVERAERCYSGIGAKKNIHLSLSLFAKAADKGSGYACRRLGLEYSDFAFNDATPRDHKKARKWFEKGAELGDAECAFYLSQFVFEGWGGAKDEQKATELLISAARKDSMAAAHRAVKLAKKKLITLSAEDEKNFYVLDKRLRNAVTLR